MNTETIRRLADAVDAIQNARDAAHLDIIKCYCDEAMEFVELAMRSEMEGDDAFRIIGHGAAEDVARSVLNGMMQHGADDE